MTGVASSVARKARTASSVPASVAPFSSARSPAAWIAGPSAIGSVNGMPSSIRSAPAAGSALRMASAVAPSGSPDMVKVTRPARFACFSASKRRTMRVLMAS